MSSLPDLPLNHSEIRLTGAEIIADTLKTLPESAGVYRFFSSEGVLLYVGKAKSLKKRLANYAHYRGGVLRTQTIINLTARVEVLYTKTEVEALILEADLIKTQKPRYNILLKDDKSYPFLFVATSDNVPFVRVHRGNQKEKGAYFGPFGSRQSLESLIESLQKIFLVRTCDEATFRNRSRPCLLHQIKRCSAPCTGEISSDDYQGLIQQALAFLRGDSKDLVLEIETAMKASAVRMEFEKAGRLRDRLFALRTFLEKEALFITNQFPDVDIFSVHQEAGIYAFQVFIRRGGRSWGDQLWLFKKDDFEGDNFDLEGRLTELMAQFYQDKQPPALILSSHAFSDISLIKPFFKEHFKRTPSIETPQKGDKKKMLDDAIMNTKRLLSRHVAEKMTSKLCLHQLAELLELRSDSGEAKGLERVEIYDNAHIQGQHTVGGMVVYTPDGWSKKEYRSWPFEGNMGGDDYLVMRGVMEKRFKSVFRGIDGVIVNEGTAPLPDLMIIDGGLGQLSAVLEVLADKGLIDIVPVLAISKGENRNAGQETLHTQDKGSFQLAFDDARLYFLQRLRDEAHRFANTKYQKKHQKGMKASALDGISGLGTVRKRLLMKHFGSVSALKTATLDDLLAIKGLPEPLAIEIYEKVCIPSS